MTKVRSRNNSMIDDRRSGGGSGGFLGGGGGGFPFPMKAGGGLMGVLVMVAALVLPRLLGADAQSVAGGQLGAPTADSADGTCSSELEQVICGATNDVQDYWATALPQFFNTQYPATKTVFFTGSVSTGCGNATSQTGPFYCPADSFVYLDLEFLQQLESQLVGTTADLAEQYIVAHEFGHHVQNVLGTNARVQEAQQNDPSQANQYSIALELQADCYAGAWVGDVAARNQLDSSGEIAEALAAAEGVGDDRIQEKTQGRIDPEAWTHGSAEQRQSWFMTGYNSVDPSQCDTFSEIL